MPKTLEKGVGPVGNRTAKGAATAAKVRPASDGVDVRALLKAGVHFGHKTSHWNPKMRPYLHSQRGGIYIIDLIKTAEKLEHALKFVEGAAAAGKQVLFVGTKKHMREVVKQAATNAGMPYVDERWFGGILTNFETINARVKQLLKLEEQLASNELKETSTKREIGEITEEVAKLNVAFGGIKSMSKLPAALFVADCLNDRIAIREAKRLNIPVIGIVDSNADPSEIDYPVPGNDDAVSAVELISNYVAEAAKAGKAQSRPETSLPTGQAGNQEPETRKTEDATKLIKSEKTEDSDAS